MCFICICITTEERYASSPAGYACFPFWSFCSHCCCSVFCLSGVLFTATASAAIKFNVANVILCCFTAFIWLFFGLLIGCKVNGGTSLFWLNELVECSECIFGRPARSSWARMGDGGDAVMCGGNGPKKLWIHRIAQSNKKGNRVFVWLATSECVLLSVFEINR